MHPEYRIALQGKVIDSMQTLKQAAYEAQETIKWRRTYKPPPCDGSVEPSLVWHPSESEANLANKSDRESRAPFYRDDAPSIF